MNLSQSVTQKSITEHSSHQHSHSLIFKQKRWTRITVTNHVPLVYDIAETQIYSV
jgi:hypothetical protein